MSKPKILVGICSCQPNKHKREACRTTWLASPVKQIQTVFFVGGGETLESDVVVLDVEDTYAALTQKVTAFFQFAIRNFEFDYLFKCDDDTYVRLDALHQIIAPEFDLVGKLIDGHEYASGGAGYMIALGAVESVCKLLPLDCEWEDIAISNAVKSTGEAKLKWDDRLQWDSAIFPSPSNNMVTAHWCSPQLMQEIYHGLTGTNCLNESIRSNP